VKILIVDDDEELNRLLSRFLERNGYEVCSALDAAQALELLGRAPDVGLVITDLNMPHLDGLGLLERLRQDPLRRGVPVVVITAYADEAKADLSMRQGAAFFLPKPIDFEQLLTLVKFAE
jgi:two-component system, chemotaxis family, chemotaxis protein CheY